MTNLDDFYRAAASMRKNLGSREKRQELPFLDPLFVSRAWGEIAAWQYVGGSSRHPIIGRQMRRESLPNPLQPSGGLLAFYEGSFSDPFSEIMTCMDDEARIPVVLP